MLNITSNKLNGVTKPLAGTYGSGNITIDYLNYRLMIGDMQFPLSPLNKISFYMNGMLGLVDNRLAVTIDNIWHTTNVLSFETTATSEPSQAASYTIQNGERAIVMSNLSPQKNTILFDESKPVTITAVNYSTGATTSTTLTPESGQAYLVESVSETRIEGELKTQGGELIEGGELKDVCVREDFNIATTPTFLELNHQSKLIFQLIMGDNALLPKDIVMLDEVFKFKFDVRDTDFFDEVRTDIGSYSTMSLEQRRDYSPIAAWRYEYKQLELQNPLLLKNINTGEFIPVQSNNPMKLQAGQYEFGLQNSIGGKYTKFFSWYDLVNVPPSIVTPGFPYLQGYVPISNSLFNLTSDSTIYIEASKSASEQTEFVFASTRHNGEPGKELHGFATGIVDYSIKVKGPLEMVCVEHQTIDTRYSYTTPVVTTDTRKTINEIRLIVTPKN